MYNGEKYIAETLDSVLTQKQKPDEIVVVDDGSTDSSRDIVRNFPDVLLLKNSGKGSNAARNFGVEHTSSEYLAFIDQDDLWHPEHLQLLSSALHEYGSAAAAVSGISDFLNNSKPAFSEPLYQPETYDPWDEFPNNNIAEPACALIRREHLLSAGLWSSDYEGASDYYLWLRLAIMGLIIRNRSITAGHRLHEHSYAHVLRDDDRIIRNMENRIAACRDAIGHLSIVKNNTDIYQKRNETQIILKILFQSIKADDEEYISSSMAEFSMNVAKESDKYILDIWDKFGWFLKLYLQQSAPGHKDNYLFALKTLELIKFIPESYERVKDILKRDALSVITGVGAKNLLLEKPFEKERWQLLGGAIMRKFGFL
jgi:glycosyltransferase involved in cell wall biosynthesis